MTLLRELRKAFFTLSAPAERNRRPRIVHPREEISGAFCSRMVNRLLMCNDAA
jgi:hypothetical protein